MGLYAGVGSRKTPREVLTIMDDLAATLRSRGWTLRSGHAPGADQAFEHGARGMAQIYLPWSSFEHHVPTYGAWVQDAPSIDAYSLASRHVPHWSEIYSSVRALHARNVHQILGPQLDDPVRFMVCWTPGANKIGGTATAIRIAEAWGVDVFNLALASARSRVERMLRGK